MSLKVAAPTSQQTAHSTVLDGKPLLLKMLYTCIVKHGVIKLVHTMETSPLLASFHRAERGCYSTGDPTSYNNVWLAKICPLYKSGRCILGLTNYLLFHLRLFSSMKPLSNTIFRAKFL